jgi:hypothetical protein
MRLIALKDLSLVADDIGIVSKILMMLYIARYMPRFVACRVLNSLSRLSNLSLMHIQTCASRLGYDSWGHFINLYK